MFTPADYQRALCCSAFGPGDPCVLMTGCPGSSPFLSQMFLWPTLRRTNCQPVASKLQTREQLVLGEGRKKIFRPWQDEDEQRSTVKLEGNFKADILNRDKGMALLRDCCDQDDLSKSTIELVATNLGKTSDGHRCIYCGKLYSRKYGLKIHLRTHTGFKPLRCRICQRPFGDPSNLNKHTRLHSIELCGQSTLKCPFCGKCLVRKRDLDRHVASRHHAEARKGQDAATK